jgi:hypothetical protein
MAKKANFVEQYKQASAEYSQQPDYRTVLEAIDQLSDSIRSQVIAVDLEGVLLSSVEYVPNQQQIDLCVPRSFSPEVIELLQRYNDVLIWTAATREHADKIISSSGITIPKSVDVVTREDQKEIVNPWYLLDGLDLPPEIQKIVDEMKETDDVELRYLLAQNYANGSNSYPAKLAKHLIDEREIHMNKPVVMEMSDPGMERPSSNFPLDKFLEDVERCRKNHLRDLIHALLESEKVKIPSTLNVDWLLDDQAKGHQTVCHLFDKPKDANRIVPVSPFVLRPDVLPSMRGNPNSVLTDEKAIWDEDIYPIVGNDAGFTLPEDYFRYDRGLIEGLTELNRRLQEGV